MKWGGYIVSVQLIMTVFIICELMMSVTGGVQFVHYLVQQISQSVINKRLSVCPSYVFRPVQGLHHGCIFKGTQIQQIL